MRVAPINFKPLQWERNLLISTSDICTFHLYAHTCLAPVVSHTAWCTLPISNAVVRRIAAANQHTVTDDIHAPPPPTLMTVWLTSCCSKLQAVLSIARPAPLMVVTETSDESERPAWGQVINCSNNRQLLHEGEFRVWGGWVKAVEMRWSSAIMISLTLTCQLAWHQISSAGTWPSTATSKQLQTSLIRSCALASSQWLEMLRWNGPGGRQQCQWADTPSRHAGCCHTVWALCGLTWRQLVSSPVSVRAVSLAMLKSTLRQ